jgi:hypothetical protein
MEFFNGLAELLFSESGTISGDKSFLLGIFASGSTIMGVIVVVLDALIFYSFGKSPVNLTHKGLNILRFIIFWGLGAGFGGFIGAAAGILQINRAACLTAGIGWPLILPRLIESAAKLEDTQTETQEEES